MLTTLSVVPTAVPRTAVAVANEPPAGGTPPLNTTVGALLYPEPPLETVIGDVNVKVGAGGVSTAVAAAPEPAPIGVKVIAGAVI